MLLILVFILTVLLFSYILLRGFKRSSRKPLPIPLAKHGSLPILGHLIPFLTDKSKFIFECKRLYGSRFYIQLVSQRMIFLLDPSDWASVYHNQNMALSLKDFGRRVYGVSSIMFADESFSNDIHRYFKQYLQSNEALSPLVQRFTKCVRDTMMKDRSAIGARNWKQCGLSELSHYMIFEASGRTLFGEMNPLAIEKPFLTFDKYISYFVLPLPNFFYKIFFRKALQGRHDMATYINAHSYSSGASEFIRRRTDRILEMQGRLPSDLGAMQASIFWASVANTMPATFWCLFYILSDSIAIQKIQEEIHTHLPALSLSDPQDTNVELWTSVNLSKCIYLESAVNEVLRIQGNAMAAKKCFRDTVIQLPDGTILPVKANDMITFYPETSHHDPNYFPDPDLYKFDRFVGKNADTVKGFLPFGSGKSMCPGRHYAKNELKICTALILYNIDYEFVDKNPNPVPRKDRVGLGLSPPVNDILIRYRYRD